jgi:hypothetical protein
LLDKCSNPSCRSSFRYINDGRLFRIDSDPSGSSSYLTKSEYFWLCQKCARAMSLRLTEDATVEMFPSSDTLRPAKSAVDFVAIHRKGGLVLSCLNFMGGTVASRLMQENRGKLLYAS